VKCKHVAVADGQAELEEEETLINICLKKKKMRKKSTSNSGVSHSRLPRYTGQEFRSEAGL
jgi:hypothetical protein